MAEEDQTSEGQNGEAGESSGGGAKKPAAPAPAAQGFRSYLTHALNKKILVGGLLFTWPLLIILIIIFLGVWAAAISGFFGERAGREAERDHPERLAVIDRRNATLDQTLRIPTGGVAPPGGPCNMVIPDPLDWRFLNEGFTFTQGAIGAPPGTHIEPDVYMLTTMRYLCERHSRIAISHIISAYIHMRLDPEEMASRDPQIIANISAHNRGQAYDVPQIDYVYKVFRHPCPFSPLWTIEYWNDEPRLLLTLPCREPINNVNTTFAGGPATAIPINVVWQDQPAQFAPGGLPFNIDTGLRMLSSYLGLSPDMLRFVTNSFPDMLSQIGRSYLEELLRLPTGSLLGNDLSSMLESAFGTRLSSLLGQLPRPEWGTTILDWARSTGAGWWERTIGLFPGSFQGWNSAQELARSVGLETAANILRIPSSILGNPSLAAPYLASLSGDDLATISNLGTGTGGVSWGPSLVPVVEAVRSGNQDLINNALAIYGTSILEMAFSAPLGSFGPCQEGGDNVERTCPDPYAGVGATASRTGLDEGTIRGFIDTFRAGDSFTILFGERGAPLLETAFALPPNSLTSLLSSPDGTCRSLSDELRSRCQTLLDPTSIGSIAQQLGIDTTLAQNLLTQFTQGQQLLSSMQQIGSSLLSSAFQLSDPTALFQIATNIASAELRSLVERELGNLALSLNLPADIVNLSRLFSGDFSQLSSILGQLGGLHLGDIFGLDISQIQRLIGGDLSTLLNLPSFQDLAQSILEAFGFDINQITGLFNGLPLLAPLSAIGNALNLFSALGLDQALVMELVYRPEARRKVHLVLRELLEIRFVLDDIDLRVTQLITYSHERDVQPFEDDGTLNRVYGVNRSRNFGLFSMREAFDHLHIAY